MDLHLIGTVHRDPSGKKYLLNLIEELRPAVISLEVSPASVGIRKAFGREWMRLFRKNIQIQKIKTGRSASELMCGSHVRGVFEYLRLPYEYRAGLEFARKKKTPLFLMDDSELASSYLSRVKAEILSSQNMDLLIKADLDQENGQGLGQAVADQYRQAWKKVFGHGEWPPPGYRSRSGWKDWEIRESSLARKLKLLHQGLERRRTDGQRPEDFIGNLIIAPEAVAYMPERVNLAQGVHVYVGGWEHLVDDPDEKTLFSMLEEKVRPERHLCRHPE